MLRRLGPVALTIGSLLSAGSASAQGPLSIGDGMGTVPARSTSLLDAAPVSHATPPAGSPLVQSTAAFNPYAVHDELKARANSSPLWSEPTSKPSDYYRCSDCVSGNCGKHGLSGLKDKLKGLGGHGGLNGHGNGDFGTGPDFQCANCWSTFNFEHKTFVSYQYKEALRTATEVGYGQAHGATAGVEWLPWVYRDDARHFSRWGFLTAFDYNHYLGNSNAILQSELSGNVLSSASGNSFGGLFGPVWRSDIFLFGCIRMSPSISAGLDVNWVTMKEQAPAAFPPPPIVRPDPQPTFVPSDVTIRSIEEFKYTDFCVGGYGRVLFDFPVRQKLNLGFGMDLRISKTDTFVRRDEYRKHFGLILQVTGEF
jgi:hypothetical protein